MRVFLRVAEAGRCFPLVRLGLIALTALLMCDTVVGQVMTVRDVLERKEEWPKLAQEQRRLQLEGRFDSRSSDSFKLDRLDVIFRHPSTLKLPDRIRKGQRIEISGMFVEEGSRVSFVVNRMLVRDTDLDALIRQAEEIGGKAPDQLLNLAATYVDRAEFYEDADLKKQIAAVRSAAMLQKLHKGTPATAAFESLLDEATKLGVSAVVLDEIRYRTVLSQLAETQVDLPAAVGVCQQMDGWDKVSPPAVPSIRDGFQRDAVAIYAKASEPDRRSLHRLLFIRCRIRQIESELKSDGSNGIALAKQVRLEFPAEKETIQSLEEKEVTWHLGRTDKLTRQDLIQIHVTMKELGRDAQAQQVVSRWLQFQEQRFGLTTLAGLLRTADEYLFAGEQWKQDAWKTKGIDLLKQAWTRAETESPDDAAGILERLKGLGWERLRGQWMTNQQIQALPGDDVELAIREGRVVRGMNSASVLKSLGKPLQVSRVVSASAVREMWVYEEAGLVIRLKRNRAEPSSTLTVEEVTRTR